MSNDNNETKEQYEALQAKFEVLSRQLGEQQAEISQLKTELGRVKEKTAPAGGTNRLATSRRKMLKSLLLGSTGLLATSAALATTTHIAQARMNNSGDNHWGGASVPNDGFSDPDVDFSNISAGLYGIIATTESNGFTVSVPVNTGVYGTSKVGYGGYFKGSLAPLALEPGASAGAPTTGTHLGGEFYVDSNGQLFYCTTGGTSGKWANLSGGTLQFLSKPVRIVDTVNGTTLNTGTGTITGFGQASASNPSGSLIKTYKGTGTVNSVNIPTNAKAITGYLYVYPGYNRLTIKPGYGYLTLWQGNTAYPLATANEGVSTLRFLNGTEASTAFIVPLASNTGTFNAAVSVTTHLVIEITGYYA